VLPLRGNLQQYVPTPAPTPRFVSQSLDALLQKSLRPFVHMATAEPDHGSNVGDRDPIGEEEDNPGTSEQPDTDGRRPLPREERPAFRRREGDDEGGFASTSHTAPLSHTGEARYTMGVQVFSGDHVQEGRPRCHRPAPSPSLRRQTVPGSRRSGEDYVTSCSALHMCISVALICRSGVVWTGCRHPP
jgi:hypothetical protein